MMLRACLDAVCFQKGAKSRVLLMIVHPRVMLGSWKNLEIVYAVIAFLAVSMMHHPIFAQMFLNQSRMQGIGLDQIVFHHEAMFLNISAAVGMWMIRATNPPISVIPRATSLPITVFGARPLRALLWCSHAWASDRCAHSLQVVLNREPMATNALGNIEATRTGLVFDSDLKFLSWCQSKTFPGSFSESHYLLYNENISGNTGWTAK